MLATCKDALGIVETPMAAAGNEASMLIESNRHKELVETNYFDSELAQAGKLFLTINAGMIRLLVPPAQMPIIKEIATAKIVVISRGPYPELGFSDGCEIMFDDGTDEPFVLTLDNNSFSPAMPGDPGAVHWEMAIYTQGEAECVRMYSVKAPVRWRRVAQLPCLKEWKGG